MLNATIVLDVVGIFGDTAAAIITLYDVGDPSQEFSGVSA
jgi:hypothetical protein